MLLKHPWFQKINKMKITPPSKLIRKEVLENINEFAKANDFQQIIMSVLSNLYRDRNELKRLAKVFLNFDTNKDGKLSKQEIRKVLSKENFKGSYEDILDKCDSNKDGWIDFDEFYTSAMKKKIYNDK